MFTESTMTVDGCNIRFRRGGKGPPLLYLHGANGAAAIQPFMEKLAEKFDVMVPEHPGFGQSDEPEWLDNVQDLAYFYLDVLDQLKLEKVAVIGSSIGGWLAMEMAIREPRRFEALVLVGPAGIRIPEAQPGDIFLWSAETAARKLFVDPKRVEFALANPPDIDTGLKNKHTVAKLAWEPRLHNPMLAKWLHRLKMPVQLAWGEQDQVIPVAYAHAFKKLIPQAQLQLFPNCGHLPQTEQPEKFVQSAIEFLQGAAK
ncbi:MAG TPA: alpha/beta hydrolase [Ramlibacter sp.]|nr:alpha/beta hydrolase [Ramlibacter sp.]